jgi:hypothetical protein
MARPNGFEPLTPRFVVCCQKIGDRIGYHKQLHSVPLQLARQLCATDIRQMG